MEVRRIPPGEADANAKTQWLRLRLGLWPECSKAQHRQEMDAMLACGERWAVFAAVDQAGHWCGFAEASLRQDEEAIDRNQIGFLEAWYVAEGHRASGIGRRLVAAAEAWAIAKGCMAMGSDARLDNVVSQAAHRALGYREVNRAVAFRKELA